MGKVLVTGGSGYIGSRLVEKLSRDYDVVVLETMLFGNPINHMKNVKFIKGDIQNEADVYAALDGVSHVIHLAGIVTDELVDLNMERGYEINVDGMVTLCNASLSCGVERFIYASSSSVYGVCDVPANEYTIPNPVSAYAKTKLVGEEVLKVYNNLNWAIVRSATACGPSPRMRFDTIVNVFSKQAYFDKRITVHGGSQYRSNIHIEDITDLYIHLLDNDVNRVTLNAVTSNHSAAQLGLMAASISDKEPELVIDTTVTDTRSYKMATDLLITELTGWRPSRSIEDAIADNYKFFKDFKADPDNSLFYNTRRLANFMTAGR